jgi:hypothetical protein
MSWVDRLRRATGFPTVAIAQAWLDRDDVASVLESQAKFSFVRGIRHKPRPGAMRDARWRAATLGWRASGCASTCRRRGRSWPTRRRCVLRFPTRSWSSTIQGSPPIAARTASPDGSGRSVCSPSVPTLRSRFPASGCRESAGPPNSTARSCSRRSRSSACASDVREQFPVDRLCASLDEIYSGFREITKDFSALEQAALFHDNAIRIYAME